MLAYTDGRVEWVA